MSGKERADPACRALRGVRQDAPEGAKMKTAIVAGKETALGEAATTPSA